MTDISKLGEFGLIHHLTDNIKIKNESTLKGVGDDCAVLHYPDSEVLVTTDMLMEGVHFDLTYIDLQHLGYKSAMVNISDIFAMNGTPRQLTVSIALSKRFKVEDMEEFYSGLRMACDKWGVDIVGGDTTSSYTGLAISITCIGEARKEDIVYRNGAKDTDLICVTGDLGAAYMGLQLLEREKSVYYQQVDEARKKNDKHALEELKGFQPDFAGKEYLLQRQLQTEARGDIIARFRELNIRPTAMMDISDGLRMACDKWGVDIVGGDTTSSYTGLAISITCIGEARKEDIVYRNGAKDTDLICVTGDLGAAYMGLQLLEREKSVYYQQVDEARKKNDKHALEELKGFQPDFAGKEYLLQRQLQTEARGDIIARFRELNIRPTAMMDISDGLSSELMHICKQSNCGCRIYEKNIPIDYQTAVMAEELNMNVTTCALNGGEDYELLFTVPIGDHEKIQQMDNVKLIGHITRPELGQMLVTRDNQEFELKAQGWNPLSDK